MMGACITSLLLGMRELANPKLYTILIKSLIVTILAFILTIWAGWLILNWAMEHFGLQDGLFMGAGPLREAASALMAVLGVWLTWRIIAMAVVQFYADDVVELIEAEHYPEHGKMLRDVPWSEQAANAMRSAGRALLANLIAAPIALALLYTGIGPAIVFSLVNAVVLGRELHDTVWLRHQEAGKRTQNARALNRLERFILGAAVTCALSIPLLHFLAPIYGAASAAHMVNRKLSGKLAE